jgi:hypothetical protein
LEADKAPIHRAPMFRPRLRRRKAMIAWSSPLIDVGLHLFTIRRESISIHNRLAPDPPVAVLCVIPQKILDKPLADALKNFFVELSRCGRKSVLSAPRNAISLNPRERVWFTEEES